MEELNNPDSNIYKTVLEKQIRFITLRLNTIKSRYINDEMGCCGDKESIAKHLNQGIAQNLIQSFFNYKIDTCFICNKKKGCDGVTQIERAHCNNYSRYDLLIMAIDELYIDNNTPIKTGDILKLFIQKHFICPIYMLCNICHKKYDNNKI